MKTLFLLLISTTSFAALNFEQAIEKIIARSTEVATQEATLKSIEASNLPDRLTYLPTLSLDASQSISNSDLLGTGEQQSRTLGASASVNLFKFGADAAKIDAAYAEQDAQRFRVLNTILTQEQSGMNALANYLEAIKRKKIYDEIVKLREKAHRIAKKRFKLGYLAKQQVDTVFVDLNNSIANQLDSESALLSARASLINVLGTDTVTEEWPWKERLLKSKLLETTIESLKKRPDWRSAQKTVEFAEETASQYWGQMLPSLDLTARAGYGWDLDQSTEGVFWSGQLTLSIPLFDRLDNYGSYRAQVHQKSAAVLSLEQVKRDAKEEWEAAMAAFRISLGNARTRDQTEKTSEKILGDYIKRFNRGRISINDLQIDQERYLNAKILAVAGWKQVHVNYTKLCHSVGMRLSQCLKMESQP